MISQEEIGLARESLQYALQCGASAARITLTKSTEDLVATLDGEIDKVTRCADRSMNMALFVDGRYGSFSINKLDRETLQGFIAEAIKTVRMLAPDPFRCLPVPARYCRKAWTGRELGIYDNTYESTTPADRVQRALDAAVWGKAPQGVTLVSEEGEYSDSEYDTYVLDSQGLECRHTETSFDYGVEVTIQDSEGNKYSDYWWTASPFLRSFDASQCGLTAVQRASAQIGSEPVSSGKYKMVVGTEVASRLVSPLLNALNAYSIQQGNSFLVGSDGRQIFAAGLNIMDEPWRKGEAGSKLFDGEGVATTEAPIIENGTVRRYFINSYMAGKLGMAPTVEDAI
ncbi:MAG: TldD/PmbA family protein, partial [Bacteroidales bacterium]|nr:TldD/PmbA family protein [Bacteroidales bacterium]